MKRVSWLVIGVFALGLLAVLWFVVAANAGRGSGQSVAVGSLQTAQLPPGGPGGQGRPGPMSPAEMAKMRQQMLERMVDQSDLSDAEKAAAKQALKVKQQARTALEEALTKLRRVANASEPTDQQLTDALTAYRAAMVAYRDKIEKADAGLIEQLSLMGQLRCLSLGVLDNGVGPMNPQGGPGGDQGEHPGLGPPPPGAEPLS